MVAMARVLGVSRAGYYAFAKRTPSAHAQADAVLLKRIRTVHASARQTYGAPRIHAELREAGERHGRKRIARLMRQAGLVGACHRHGSPVRRDNQDESVASITMRMCRRACAAGDGRAVSGPACQRLASVFSHCADRRPLGR